MSRARIIVNLQPTILAVRQESARIIRSISEDIIRSVTQAWMLNVPMWSGQTLGSLGIDKAQRWSGNTPVKGSNNMAIGSEPGRASVERRLDGLKPPAQGSFSIIASSTALDKGLDDAQLPRPGRSRVTSGQITHAMILAIKSVKGVKT